MVFHHSSSNPEIATFTNHRVLLVKEPSGVKRGRLLIAYYDASILLDGDSRTFNQMWDTVEA